MPQHRESPSESLKGQIVLFQFLNNNDRDTVLLIEEVFTVGYGNPAGALKGQLIAYGRFTQGYSSVKIHMDRTITYRVLSLDELPLLLGYEYTSPLLAELLQGD